VSLWVDLLPRRHASLISPTSPASAQCICGAWRGLVVSLKGLLQNQLVQRQLRHSLLQTTILSLKFLKTPGLRNLHPTEIFPPTLIGLLRDPEAPADTLNLLPLRELHFSFSQHADNLFWRESFMCHFDLLSLSRFEYSNSKPGLVKRGQVKGKEIYPVC